jgi:hypothetical protein
LAVSILGSPCVVIGSIDALSSGSLPYKLLDALYFRSS